MKKTVLIMLCLAALLAACSGQNPPVDPVTRLGPNPGGGQPAMGRPSDVDGS